ncbi:hypothetical protein OnM2_066048 [Erysiphe neolycopersici]|uniref:Uncharacterized protein n=1 Tax=Erysiphe neolycopersici TaxID=212602 RepID=A0A420HMP2_9PEZI|nr:hypothetical protein OnM2_066048 [Erysiphe neolycopersici]
MPQVNENLISYIARAKDLWNLAGGRKTIRTEPIYDMGFNFIMRGCVSAIENGAMGVTDLKEEIS